MEKFNSLKDVQEKAMELIKKHLNDDVWTFKFDRAFRRFGCCKYGKCEITLSKPLTEKNLNNYEQIVDVILHEIAHAISVNKHGHWGKGHGFHWKQTCIQIGANPKRCFSANEVETIQGKYVYKCPNCGHEMTTHKRLKRLHACSACCNKYNSGKFSNDFLFELNRVN